MICISENLKAQKTQLIRLARNIVLGLLVFFAVDRGLDALLLRGLDRYFGLQTPNAILLVGHSHVVLGIDKVELEQKLGRPVSKYARAGAQLEDRILMVRHYSELHPMGPSAVVFGVDGHLFTPRGLSSNAHRLFYPHMDDLVIESYLRGHEEGWQEYMVRHTLHLARYNDVLINSARRGIMRDWSSGINSRFNPDRLAQEVELGDVRRILIDPGQVTLFREFLEEAEARGWCVILTFVPTTNVWNELELEKFEQVVGFFEEFAANYPMVHYLDMRDPWSEQHELFADPIHLNAQGQKLVTADLAERLVSIPQCDLKK